LPATLLAANDCPISNAANYGSRVGVAIIRRSKIRSDNKKRSRVAISILQPNCDF
jgi:hypothetical protein